MEKFVAIDKGMQATFDDIEVLFSYSSVFCWVFVSSHNTDGGINNCDIAFNSIGGLSMLLNVCTLHGV